MCSPFLHREERPSTALYGPAMPYQSSQHYFEYFPWGCFENPTDKRGECPHFWSLLTPRISTLDLHRLEAFVLH